MAFGLKSAPAYAFVVSAEVKRILESFGVQVAGVYLDNFLIRGASRQECADNLAKAISILQALGIPSNEKTVGPRSPEEGIVFLGVHIRTSDCSLTVTAEHRQYAVDRLESLLAKKTVSLKELESVSGVLSCIAQVFIPGRPRRNSLFAAIHRLKERKANTLDIRGELRHQLHRWRSALRDNSIKASSHFWISQPVTPLMCSDVSGEDGLGACACGVHVVGTQIDHNGFNSNLPFRFLESRQSIRFALSKFQTVPVCSIWLRCWRSNSSLETVVGFNSLRDPQESRTPHRAQTSSHQFCRNTISRTAFSGSLPASG